MNSAASSPEAANAVRGGISARLLIDLLVLAGGCAFLFFFGLGAVGLIGADEPRYAQIAREMLARHDWVTPVLSGKPWLEKPILYYWQAMLSYRVFGVSDWAARVPAAVDATTLVVAVYFFARRFVAGVALDAALIAASSAFIVGFGHAASTDMPLAATFTIAMLSWAAWHLLSDAQSAGERRLWLISFYLFLALATLAKGPVAPFLAVLVIVPFAALRRQFGIIRRTLSLPGIVVYLMVVLPWYVLVQLRTGNFFRVFILEHNLERYSTTVYHHTQPFWYFVPVLLLALLPWTVLAVAGLIEGVRLSSPPYTNEPVARVAIPVVGHASRLDSEKWTDLHLLLALWGVLPVIFFSFSGSKLPGYILPAVPPFALMIAAYLRRRLAPGVIPHRVLVLLHSIVAGATLALILLAPYWLLRLHPARQAVTIATLAGALVFAVVAITVHRTGLKSLRFITLLPVILGLTFLLRIAAPTMDESLSARPVAREVARIAPPVTPVALFNTPRELEYGLAFYRNEPMQRYERGEVPSGAHLLVAAYTDPADLARYLGGRGLMRLGNFRRQGLDFYWVSAK